MSQASGEVGGVEAAAAMLILVSGARPSVAKAGADIGVLLVPAAHPTLREIQGREWAADNSAFTQFNAERFLGMLRRFRGQPGCRFVTAPDVVGKAQETGVLFQEWAPLIRSWGYPVALVAQDGLTVTTTPWDEIDALFIGGTTEFKLGVEARTLGAYAKARGKWLHMGRVNSRRRMHYAARIGCDSIDGTCFSMFPDLKIALGEKWLRERRQQPELQL